MRKSILFLFASSFLIGCSGVALKEGLTDIPDKSPIHLELRGSAGQSDLTYYHSNTISKNLSGGELVKKSAEITEFQVRTELAQVDAQTGDLVYKVKTVEKSGQADLHDFAVPNLGEEIEFTMSKLGEIKKAGEAPRGTIFFVPPISLPKNPVQVGDTWEMKTSWISLKTAVPLEMEVVSILTGVKKCGEHTCALIDVSGGVKIMGLPNNFMSSREGVEEIPMRFSSRINGQILFNVDKGLIVYSQVLSEERLSGPQDAVEINSCIVSKVEEPENLRIIREGAISCAPAQPLKKL